MKWIIHIGVHKTGTTAIQNWCHKNHRALAKNGVLYQTPSDEDINHHRLARQFRKDSRYRQAGQNILSDLDAAARRNGCDRILISSEMFSVRNAEVPTFLSSLNSTAVETIAYIRRPDEIVKSAYDQVVRNRRGTQSISEPPFAYDPSYLTPLSQWLREETNLKLCPYDSAQWKDGRLISDFASMLGITDLSSFSSLDQSANISLPFGLTEVLRIANGLQISDAEQGNFLSSLQDLYDKHPDAFAQVDGLSKEARKSIFDSFQKGLPTLRNFFRPGFDENFLSSDHPLNGS